ncbi:MAG: DUF2203 family protein [Planctomycetota bacterium]
MVGKLNHAQAKSLLPLLRSISREIRERRSELDRVEKIREELVAASELSPEGFLMSLQDLDAMIRADRRGLEAALRELKSLGLEVPSIDPLIIYIPGQADGQEVVYFWEEPSEEKSAEKVDEETVNPDDTWSPC